MLVMRYILVILGVEPSSAVSFAVSGVLLLLALILDWKGIRTPSTGQQVPAGWRQTMRPTAWVGGFGFILGFAFLTRIPIASLWAVFVAASLTPDRLSVALLFGATFGLIRSLVVFRPATAVAERQTGRERLVDQSVGLSAVVLGSVLVAAISVASTTMLASGG